VGKVLQVPRDFIAPVTVSMEKCSRWNISSLVRYLALRPSGAVKPKTLPDPFNLTAKRHRQANFGLKYQLAQLQKKGYLLRTEGRKTGRWKVLIKK